MDSDRIAVMDDGKLAEFASPKDLLRSGGHFAKLVEKVVESKK